MQVVRGYKSDARLRDGLCSDEVCAKQRRLGCICAICKSRGKRVVMKVTFIGLGNMGAHMARHLLRAGHDVTVWNRTLSKAEGLRGEGAKISKSPAEAAKDAEVL